MTPFIKNKSKQTRKKKKRRFRIGAATSCFLVELGGAFSVSPLSLGAHTCSAAEGPALGFPMHCSVLRVLFSPQSVVWSTWRRQRMVFGTFDAGPRLQERSYFSL